MGQDVTRESRDALARATLFLEKAQVCSADARVDFEAFLEASIIFGRTALHRLKTQYERRAGWGDWWASIAGNSAVQFFRNERDWILKEAPLRVGQRVFMPFLDSESGGDSAYVPSRAAEFYFLGEAHISAADVVAEHLAAMTRLVAEAEARFNLNSQS